MAQVYIARYQAQQVAAKVAVAPLNLSSAAASKMIDSEMSTLSRLSHNNIVSYMGTVFVESHQLLCILEELCIRGSLSDAIYKDARRLAEAEIAKVCRDVSSAMSYMHPTVIHMDLKPSNMLISSEGNIKVCDFGIGKLLFLWFFYFRGVHFHLTHRLPESAHSAMWKQHTYATISGSAGIFGGTIGYMAPEIMENHRPTEKVDLWSFAISTWELYTRR